MEMEMERRKEEVGSRKTKPHMVLLYIHAIHIFIHNQNIKEEKRKEGREEEEEEKKWTEEGWPSFFPLPLPHSPQLSSPFLLPSLPDVFNLPHHRRSSAELTSHVSKCAPMCTRRLYTLLCFLS